MTRPEQHHSKSIRLQALGALVTMFVVSVFAVNSAEGQAYTVIHNFAGYDGNQPMVGLTMDRGGSLYGTTFLGGTGCAYGCGTVFKLVRNGSDWILKPLYEFAGGTDGANPDSRVIFGPDGNLYGTTTIGGQYGAGTVYKLQPPASACKSTNCLWRETILYSFTGLSDGGTPEGDLIFDSAGNLYGTTFGGAVMGECYSGCGVVYELMPSHGSWTCTILYTFTGLSDGGSPTSGVILDRSGNLYGTTSAGGSHFLGTVFELAKTGAGWTENVLHSFQGAGDGENPESGLVFDPAGNLYGLTIAGGGHNNGTAFELQTSSGSWNYSGLFNFGLQSGQPISTPILDSAGNLYGTAYSGGRDGVGAIFKLTPAAGSWNYSSLHDFVITDGARPQGNVILDAQGNVYGTALGGGASGDGVVFEITP